MADQLASLTSSNFVQVTAQQTWSNLPLVVASGLLFAVVAAPAAVLGYLGFVPLMTAALAMLVSPAWSSLLHLLMAVVEGRSISLLRVPQVFVRLWRRSARLGVLLVVPIIVAWLMLPAFAGEHVPTMLWIGLGADLLAMALVWSIGLYAYPMLATHDLSLFDAIRNSMILASRHAMNTVGMVSMAVLCLVVAGVIGSVVFLFLPAVYGMFVVNNYRLVMADELNR